MGNPYKKWLNRKNVDPEMANYKPDPQMARAWNSPSEITSLSRNTVYNKQDGQNVDTNITHDVNYERRMLGDSIVTRGGIVQGKPWYISKVLRPDGSTKYNYNYRSPEKVRSGWLRDSVPADLVKEIDSLYNAGTQRFPIKRQNNGGQIKPNFIKRLEDPNRKHIMDWEDPRRIATHKMAADYYHDGSGRAIAYPFVQEINGQLIDFTRPPWREGVAYDSAIQNKDYLMFDNLQDAIHWTETYKDKYKNFKK